MKRKIKRPTRSTVYQIANEMGIKDRRIICRAGRMIIKRLREKGLDSDVASVSQVEYWNNKRRVFNVASYPPYSKIMIIQMLEASEIIQKDVDKS